METRKGHVPIDGCGSLEVGHLASADREAADDEDTDERHFDESDTDVKASTDRCRSSMDESHDQDGADGDEVAGADAPEPAGRSF